MKRFRRVVSSVLAAVGALSTGGGSLSAQIIEFSGSITAVSGGFSGGLGLGAPVAVALDLRPPLVDALPEDECFGLFLGRRIGLRLAGQAYPVDAWPNEVLISRSFSGHFAGLSVGAAWPATLHPRVVVLALVGDTDRVVSDSAFPAGIPMECFAYHEGSYSTPDGSVDWSIDSYTFSANMAVPEPATYGMAAALVAAGLAAWRRWKRGVAGAGARRDRECGPRERTMAIPTRLPAASGGQSCVQ